MDPVWDVAAQARSWDKLAAEKRFSHPLRLEWLRRYSAPRDSILDLGCGYGRTLAELERAGYESLVGVDFSFQMLLRCRAESPRRNLIQNDGRTIPLRGQSVDLAVLFAVLTSTMRDEDQIQLLAEVARVLRPGGLLYLSDLLLNEDARNLERYQRYRGIYGPYGTFPLPDGLVMRHHSKDWICELTQPFRQLEFESMEVITMNGNRSAAFQFLGRSAGVADRKSPGHV